MPFPSHHISVCICTYKRPQLLEKLLFALDGQRTDGLFSFSAVVVDNDCAESARDIVNRVGKEVQYQIEYYVEPQQNIALARNKTVLNAQGDYIAMIDDDEVPIGEWLFLLFKTLRSCKADGVLGPVRPAFSSHAPQWLIRSSLCERPSYPTGTILPSGQTRAGNVLLDRRIFDDGKNLFEEQFGKTGGEDMAFFHRRVEEGFIFVWCEEAPAYEYVPPERCLLSFHLKKYIRIGGLTGEKMRMGTFPLWGNFMMSAGVTTVYTVVLPIFAFCGWHVFVRHLVRYVYHISRLLGTLGIVIIRDR
jgi:succinoglycan biosynthesis protein ExoM